MPNFSRLVGSIIGCPIYNRRHTHIYVDTDDLNVNDCNFGDDTIEKKRAPYITWTVRQIYCSIFARIIEAMENTCSTAVWLQRLFPLRRIVYIKKASNK